MADSEFRYRHSRRGITQATDVKNLSTNYNLVAIQLTILAYAIEVSLSSSAAGEAGLVFSSRIIGEGAVTGPSILMVR